MLVPAIVKLHLPAFTLLFFPIFVITRAGKGEGIVNHRANIEQILDIIERDHLSGIIPFLAEQFMSAVHPRAVGNRSTLVIDGSSSAQLGETEYTFSDPDARMNITRVRKGELVLSHAIYRQPVKIIFPKPAFRQEGGS